MMDRSKRSGIEKCRWFLPPGEALAWRDPGLAPKLLGYDHIADVSVSHDAYRFHLTCPLVIFSKACSVKFRLVFGNWY